MIKIEYKIKTAIINILKDGKYKERNNWSNKQFNVGGLGLNLSTACGPLKTIRSDHEAQSKE